ncbi:MAG: hypothetical protein ACJAUP_001193 [Cellvibrionaceae bacterium]|jgi:hypothetical protein
MFISVVSDPAYPAALILDEVDQDGLLVTANVAQLKGDGIGSDTFLGDRVFTGSLMAGSVNAVEKFYRAHADNNGEIKGSGSLNLL